MEAQLLKRTTKLEDNPTPLQLEKIPKPAPAKGELLIKVLYCGVCHTEVDEIEGRTPPKEFPMILGHQVVGIVEEVGEGVVSSYVGKKVGVAWIYSSCGGCKFCKKGLENLCNQFVATGRDKPGGYAQYMVAKKEFTYSLPVGFKLEEIPPLLCAGVIGYRAVKLTTLEDGKTLGLFGFGASAHIVIQVVKKKFPNSKVAVFTRPNQKEHQQLAKKLNADWVGSVEEKPPFPLDCGIDFTPAWKPVVKGMEFLQKGGRLVINAIRKEEKDKEELLKMNYSTHLWEEKELKSVANVTREDVGEFLKIAEELKIKPNVEIFPLSQANYVLNLVKKGKIKGAGVLSLWG